MNDEAMNESPKSSTTAWFVAALAVLASAGWLGWQWQRRPPDFALARLYVEGRGWEKAVPMLERIVADDPGNGEAIRLLSFCYRQLDRHQDAARVLASVQGDEEETAASLFFAGQALLAGDRRRDAEQMWKRVLERESTPGVDGWKQECRRELCNLYAIGRRRREFLAVSEDLFENALPRDRYIPLQYRLKSLINVVEPNAGVRKLEPAVAADPGDDYSRAGIALYLADLDKFDEALARVKECRTRAPDELFFWEAWCQILERRGDMTGIAEAVKQLPPKAEESAIVWQMQSLAAEQRNDFVGAVAHLQRAMAVEPRPEYTHRMGQLLVRQRKTEDGNRELKRATAQTSVLGELRDFIQRYDADAPEDIRRFADWANDAANLMDRFDWADEARRWRQAALAADPSHRPSLVALERDASRRFGRN